METIENYMETIENYSDHKLYVPKKVAEIKICNALSITIDETINFTMPTEEQRKNLKEMLCIEVIPINE